MLKLRRSKRSKSEARRGCSRPDRGKREVPRMQDAGYRDGRSVAREPYRHVECWDCGARRRSRDMREITEDDCEWSMEFFGGELLCLDCAGKRGL